MSPTQPIGDIELILSCRSWQEAQRVADHLLQKRLVGRIEFMESISKYRGQGDIEAKEVTLLMQSLSSLFSEVEQEVAKIHSGTSALRQIPIANMSAKAHEVVNG